MGVLECGNTLTLCFQGGYGCHLSCGFHYVLILVVPAVFTVWTVWKLEVLVGSISRFRVGRDKIFAIIPYNRVGVGFYFIQLFGCCSLSVGLPDRILLPSYLWASSKTREPFKKRKTSKHDPIYHRLEIFLLQRWEVWLLYFLCWFLRELAVVVFPSIAPLMLGKARTPSHLGLLDPEAPLGGCLQAFKAGHFCGGKQVVHGWEVWTNIGKTKTSCGAGWSRLQWTEKVADTISSPRECSTISILPGGMSPS